MGFGDSLKKWATSKATEMVTTDRQKRADAEATADAVETQAENDVAETLFRAAFPKLGEMADRQQAAAAAREAAAEQEHRDQIAALPLVRVDLSVTGHVTATWSGPLHLRWSDVEPSEADPSDPYAGRPAVSVELFSEDAARPDLGGLMLTRWGFQLPGYRGDGTYDLTAIAHEREPAGISYEEWVMEFANSDDSSFYFYEDSGQSDVAVSEGGKRLEVRIAMTGATGDLTATATITR
jgi:hypothetical protein